MRLSVIVPATRCSGAMAWTRHSSVRRAAPSDRMGGRKLKMGRYRLQARSSARDETRASFTIVRR